MTTDTATTVAESMAATLAQYPSQCAHSVDTFTTCGTCDLSWCDTCDPTHGPLCHACSGRGYSDASALDIGEWLEGTLDIRRTYASDGTLYSVSLLLAFGGPNVWATFNGRGADVAADWYSDVVHVWSDCPTLSADVLDAFNDWNVTR